MWWHHSGTVPGSDLGAVAWGGQGEKGDHPARGGREAACLFLSTDDTHMFGGWGQVTADPTLCWTSLESRQSLACYKP